ncbi:MAG: hypothetical protein WAV12_18135 [Trebonia sp.]
MSEYTIKPLSTETWDANPQDTAGKKISVTTACTPHPPMMT